MDKSLKSFLDYITQQLSNHSIYVWGAQGQDHTIITESWIRSRETSAANADAAIAFWKKQVAAGYQDILRAFDCSGLGMYFIQNLTGLSNVDMSANSMKSVCSALSRANVKPGDWVFRIYTSGSNKGKAYHIGYVVDNALNVIEARGRSYGVYKSHIDATPNYWNAYGRPKYFASEINADPVIPSNAGWTVSRVLKLSIVYMRGSDVMSLQNALMSLGYSVGGTAADGVFGSKTSAAVKKFQSEHGLKVDGKAGEDTVTALGGVWTGNVYDYNV